MVFDYSSPSFEEKYTYTGADLGAIWSEKETVFRLWAPTATQVYVNLYSAGDGGKSNSLPMVQDVQGTWVLTVPGNLNGVYYTYTALLDGAAIEAVDPYARTTGVNGLRGMVIDLHATDPEGWATEHRPQSPAPTESVIYELHVRDLSIHESSGITHKGKFLGLTERGTVNPTGQSTGLDHLIKLGITHLHLLPVYDYGSVDESRLDEPQFNWGYDPVNFNVPEGSYSTDPYHGEVRVREFKQMVKALHNAGIHVVMDVVYNHVYDADSFCFNRLVPGYFSRGASNGSFCGNDTASERSMVRKYIVDSVCYWTEEYHIDGFRFDLLGLLDVETVNAITQAVHRKHPHVLFYGEGWDMPTVPTKPVQLAIQKNSHLTPGFAYFNDTIRDLIRGSVWEDKELGFVSGRLGCKPLLDQCMLGMPDWCKAPAQSVNYASCHDNMTLYDRIAISRPDADRETLAQMNRLAAAIYLTAQGIPFLHAGEELLRSKNFDHNSYKSPDSVNAIRWETLSDPEVQFTLTWYKWLIRLRRYNETFCMSDAEQVRAAITPIPGLPDQVAAYRLQGKEDMIIAFNASNCWQTLPLPEGLWALILGDLRIDGDSVCVTARDKLELPPIGAAGLLCSKQ